MRIACLKALALAPLLLCACPAVSDQPPQEREETISIPLRLTKGQRFRLEYTRGNATTRPGEPSKGLTRTVSDIDVEILSADPNSCEVAWTIRKMRLFGPDGKLVEDANSSALAGLVEELRYELRLSADLKEARLLNYDAIKPGMIERLEALGRVRTKSGEKAFSEGYAEMMKSLIESQEFVEGVMLQDILLYFQMGRSEFVKGRREELETIRSFGIPMPLKREVTATVNEAGNAVIRITEHADAKKAPELLKKMAAAAAIGPTTMPTKEEMGKLKLDDRTEFVIDLKTGLPERVACWRDATRPDGTKCVEIRGFIRKAVPPATQPAQQ